MKPTRQLSSSPKYPFINFTISHVENAIFPVHGELMARITIYMNIDMVYCEKHLWVIHQLNLINGKLQKRPRWFQSKAIGKRFSRIAKADCRSLRTGLMCSSFFFISWISFSAIYSWFFTLLMLKGQIRWMAYRPYEIRENPQHIRYVKVCHLLGIHKRSELDQLLIYCLSTIPNQVNILT